MATGTTTVGFEEQLWQAADKLRSNMDAAEYKHVVLGLIFLKYVSDSFTERYNALKAEGYGDEEDRDEYLADNIFWVPKEARWETIKAHATNPDIGEVIDAAMESIEKENDSLKGVLTKNYSRQELDKTRLGELVTLFTNIDVGTTAAQEKDVLGRVYEYFLGKFASAEGKLGGEFYTPSCVVRTLVEMIEPFDGQIYDPCCGSGGMFCQSARFVKEHQGNVRDISIFGQESNPTTWKLAKMNLAIRGLEANLGKHNADTFHDDLHKTLKANYILANPPFNVSDWGGERLQDDIRWKYGVPPTSNANFAWLQHMIHHLNPLGGVAGTVLANGSLSSNSPRPTRISAFAGTTITASAISSIWKIIMRRSSAGKTLRLQEHSCSSGRGRRTSKRKNCGSLTSIRLPRCLSAESAAEDLSGTSTQQGALSIRFGSAVSIWKTWEPAP